MVMIGARRSFDPNDPQYMGQVDTGAGMAMPSMADPIGAPPTFASKPSFLGQGGVGRSIAGAIGDYLLQLNHMQPIYAPARAQQTAFERGEQQYQRRRQDALTDDATNFRQQLGLLDYKRLHPDDELTRSLDAAGINDPTERQKYYRADVERRTAPPMMSAPGVDEQGNPVMRFFPRAQVMPPPASPAPTIGTVKGGYRFKGGNPASPQAWEPVGGPTPRASGSFP